MQIAKDKHDLDLAAHALMTLGGMPLPQAGEFLSSLLKEPEFSLHRAAFIGLCQSTFFPIHNELDAFFAKRSPADSGLDYWHALLAAGKRGYKQHRERLLKHLKDRNLAVDSESYYASLLAITHMGGPEAQNTLDELLDSQHFLANEVLRTIRELHALTPVESLETISTRFDVTNRQHYLPIFRSIRKHAMPELWNVLEDKNNAGLLPPELACLLRAQFFDQKQHADANRRFMQEQFKNVSLASLGYLAKATGIASTIESLQAEQSAADFLQLCQYVKLPEPLVVLEPYFQENRTDEEKVLATNALVWQCHMAAAHEGRSAAIGAFFSGQLAKEKGLPQERLVRAMGQIGFSNPAFLSFCKDKMLGLAELDLRLESSLYYGIERLNQPEFTDLLVKRLKTGMDDPKHPLSEASLSALLKALAQMGELPSSITVLQKLSAAQKLAFKVPLVKILSQCKISGFEDMLKSCLDEDSFPLKITAIAALRRNPSPLFTEPLLKLLEHKDVSLRDYAAFSLSAASEEAQAKTLLFLLEQAPYSSALRTFLRNFEVMPGGNYRQLLKSLQEHLTVPKDPPFGHETLELAHSLMDNIVVAKFNLGANTKKQGGLDSHDIDAEIRKDLPVVTALSATIQSIIRNAELTMRNPDLFNNKVDKSTAIIEYVKSIDLILQEKVGPLIFSRNRDQMLTHMRSRIIALQLAERQGDAIELMRTLRCQAQFRIEDFPYAKIVGIGQAILTGKLMAVQYKAIDGLRAWAVILLLFARPLKLKNLDFPPLLTLGGLSKVSDMTSLCAQLNLLQDSRNLAAHHGTLLDPAKIMQVRSECFKLLEVLR